MITEADGFKRIEGSDPWADGVHATYDNTVLLHDCYKTCKHFGEKVDYPSWWFGKARCLLQTGAHTHEVEFDNTSFMYCDLYEEEGKNKDP